MTWAEFESLTPGQAVQSLKNPAIIAILDHKADNGNPTDLEAPYFWAEDWTTGDLRVVTRPDLWRLIAVGNLPTTFTEAA